MDTREWDEHYRRERSDLSYPDENLVRLLKKHVLSPETAARFRAFDLGCGGGRHLRLLDDIGISRITGLDASFNALALARNHTRANLVCGEITRLPFNDESADIVIAWGSLHYSGKDDLPVMLSEISRILSRGGHLFATLRSSRDTHMKKGTHLGDDTWRTGVDDISGAIASFYTEDEMASAFSIFAEFRYGLMERTLVGDTATLISHWVIRARA